MIESSNYSHYSEDNPPGNGSKHYGRPDAESPDTMDTPENAENAACAVEKPCCPCKKWMPLILVILACLVAAGLVSFFRCGVCGRAAYSPQCAKNIKQIGLAMCNYEERYACYPPAYVVDKNGRPAHSWRVLLLPFMGETKLYETYRFNEPWDSPTNKKVAAAAARLFQCPSANHDKDDLSTDYVLVVGKDTLSDGPHSHKAKEILDGLSDTIMVVEMADSDTPWNKPGDLNFDTMNFLVNSAKRMCISSHHAGGAYVCFCNGVARWLPEKTNPELIKSMLTIAGSEDAGNKDLE
jgi:hypothetical protein